MKNATKHTGAWLLAVLMTLGLATTQAQTTAAFTNALGGDWNTAVNWNPNAVPDGGTNAFIGNGSTVTYNSPMAAASFGTLKVTNGSTLNINAAGFNVQNGASALSVEVSTAASTGTINVNNGGAVYLTNSGSLKISTNGVLAVNPGGALIISNSLSTDSLLVGHNARYSSATFVANLYVGGQVAMSGRMTIAGSTSGGGAGTGSRVTVTNGGVLTCFGGSQINNTSDDGGQLLLVNGGTANLGVFTVARSTASGGLILSNGVINATGFRVGVGNSQAYSAVYGGALTNTGTFTVNDNTTVSSTSSDRRSRLLIRGGTVVGTDSLGIIVGNQSQAGAGGSTVFGGILDINAGLLMAEGITLLKDNSIINTYGTLNLSGTGIIYLGSVGLNGNAGGGSSGFFMNLNGGTLAAKSDFAINGNATVGGTLTIQAADAAGTPYNITGNGNLLGSGSLIKTGGGSLTLNGANTYPNSTVIRNGTVVLGAAGSLVSTPIIVGSGTTFDVSAVAGYTVSSLKTLAGSGVVTGAVNVASGGIVNPGSNTLTGILTLTNDLVATGGAVIHLDLPGDFLKVGGSLTVSGTNTFDILGTLTSGTAYPLVSYGIFNGDLTNFVVQGPTGTLSNSVVNKTIYLVIASSLRAPTNVVWTGNPSVNDWDTHNVTNWLNNGVLDFFLAGDNARFDNTGAANPLVNVVGSVSPTSITVDSTANYSLSGAGIISGTGGITKTNSGTLSVLTANNLFTGVSTIAGGILEVTNVANGGQASALGAATADPANLVLNGGAFRYSGENASTDRGMTLSTLGGSVDIASSSTALTVSGSLTGPGGLAKSGAGNLILSSANSYLGATTLSNGVLQINSTVAALANTVVFQGGTLSLSVGSQQTYSNPLNVTNVGTLISAGGNNNVMQGAWAGAGTLNLSIVSGTFTINAPMTANFTGTILVSDASAGFLRFNGGGNGSGAQQSTASATAIFDLGNSSVTLLNRNGGAAAFGVYDLGALSGGPSTIVRGASNGGGAINASFYSVGARNLNTTFAGTIANGTGGAGATTSIIKVGTGTWTLTGQNTFTGSTTVSNGVLALGDGVTDGAIGSSASIQIVAGAFLSVTGRSDGVLSLGSSQTLRGNGTVLGSVDTLGGGTIAPGFSSIATLTVTNVATLAGTATMEINRAGSLSDKLVAPTINLGGTLSLVNLGALLQIGDTFDLFDGTLSGTFTTQNLGYYTWNTSQLGAGGNGTITVTGFLPAPVLTFTSTASDITLDSTGGIPGGALTIVTSTDATAPLSTWTTVANDVFNGSGNFTLTIPINTETAQRFYALRAF